MKLGVVMDPIETINFKKDSTLAMMIEAQQKGHEIFYMTPDALFIIRVLLLLLALKLKLEMILPIGFL